MQTSQIHFTNNQYVRSHGQQPKGWGLWLFEAEFGDTVVQLQPPHSMTLAEARKDVAAQIKQIANREEWEADVYVAVLP